MGNILSKSGVPVVTVADESLPYTSGTTWVATTDQQKQGVSLYVGTGGDLVIRMVGTPAATYRTWKNVPPGFYVLANVIEIHSSTTAADIQILL